MEPPTLRQVYDVTACKLPGLGDKATFSLTSPLRTEISFFTSFLSSIFSELVKDMQLDRYQLPWPGNACTDVNRNIHNRLFNSIVETEVKKKNQEICNKKMDLRG